MQPTFSPYLRAVGDAASSETKNPNNPIVGISLLAMGIGLMVYGFTRPIRPYSRNDRKKSRRKSR